MKRFLQNVFHFFQNIFLFLLGILFRFIPERKGKKSALETISKEEKEKKYDKITSIQEETETGSALSLFQKYLKSQRKKEVPIDEFDEKFYKMIEEIFEVSLDHLSKEEKNSLEKYKRKVKENKISLDTVKSTLKEKIVLKEQQLAEEPSLNAKKKVEDPLLEIKEEKTEPILEETEKVLEKEVIPERKEEPLLKTKEVENSFMEIQEKGKDVKFELPQEKNLLEKKDFEKENVLSSVPLKNSFEPEISNSMVLEPQNLNVSEKEYFEENISTAEKKIEEVPGILEEKNEVSTLEKEQKKELKETSKKETKEVKETKKEEKQETVSIDINRMIKEDEHILEISEVEMKKDDFFEKKYEKVETLIQEKITSLENILESPLKEEQKNTVLLELQKMNILNQKVKSTKEEDLEELRVSLESGISLEDMNRIQEELKKFQETSEKEYQERMQMLKEKTEEERRLFEKEMMMQTLSKVVKRLTLVSFFSFPFIKNKYFRRFASGLFVFSGFCFLKKLLFPSPILAYPYEHLKDGRDAFSESISLTMQNKAMFEELKYSMLEKYPELQENAEFLSMVTEIDTQLNANLNRLLKEEQVMNKYFALSKGYTRKLKRRII